MKVPGRALSVFCPHCQKRAELESLRIVGSHPGKMLSTCGDIRVEATATLNLPLFANNVVILGCVRGHVVANETVVLGSTARVSGDIKAAKVIVHDGAVIEGRCVMTAPRRDAANVTGDSSRDPDPETADGTPQIQETASIPEMEALPSARPRPLRPPGTDSRP